MKGNQKLVLRLTSLGLLSLIVSNVYASGFRLEMSAASVFADSGDAAVVEDASTNFYNSAGDVYIPQQVVASGLTVFQDVKFSGNTFAAAPRPAFNFSGSGHVVSRTMPNLPAFHYIYPFKDCYALGISVVPAWGLLEEYGERSILRYDLNRIYTRTIDVAPSLSIKINNQWSVGFGPDFHYFYASSKSHVRTEPLTTTDSISRFSASSWNYGAHIGVLYRYDDATRFGLNYRTKIMQNIRGYSDFRLGLTGPNFEASNFRLPIALPATTSLSAYRDLSPCWAIMGTISYDQWSSLKNFHARNVVQPTGVIPSVNSPQNMRDTFDFGVGAHFKVNDQLFLRSSLKYEQTPTINAFRDVNFPDGPKLGLNLGAHYAINQKFAVDFAYAHVWVKTVPIHGVNPITGATAIGQTRNSLDIIGAQLVWNV